MIVKYSSCILLGLMMILGGLGVYAQNVDPMCTESVTTCIPKQNACSCTEKKYSPGGVCTLPCGAQNQTRKFCAGTLEGAPQCANTATATSPSATSCEGKTGAEKETCEKKAKECVPGPDKCCGIKLNTNVPFIGNCIEYTKDGQTATSSDPNTTTVNSLNAFPLLLGGLSRILLTVILVGSFVMVIAAGVMMAAPDALGGSFSTGQSIIRRVIAGIALLGASGIILNAINPNFFK